MFNLLIIPKKNSETHFKIEPRDGYYANGIVKDWTNKLDLSVNVIEKYFEIKNEHSKLVKAIDEKDSLLKDSFTNCDKLTNELAHIRERQIKLKEKLELSDLEIAKSKLELQGLYSKNNSIEHITSQQNQTIDALISQLSSYKVLILSLEDELNKRENIIEANSSYMNLMICKHLLEKDEMKKINELSLLEMKHSLIEKNDILSNIKTLNATLNDKVKLIEEEKNSLQLKNRQLEENFVVFERKNTLLTEENKKLKEDFGKFTQKIISDYPIYQSLVNEYNKPDSRIQSQIQIISEYNTLNKLSKEAILPLEKEINSKISEISIIRNELINKDKEISKLNERIKCLTSESDKLTKLHDNLLNSIASGKMNKVDLVILEEERLSLREENTNLKERLQNFTNLEKENKSLEQKVFSLSEEIKAAIQQKEFIKEITRNANIVDFNLFYKLDYSKYEKFEEILHSKEKTIEMINKENLLLKEKLSDLISNFSDYNKSLQEIS